MNASHVPEKKKQSLSVHYLMQSSTQFGEVCITVMFILKIRKLRLGKPISLKACKISNKETQNNESQLQCYFKEGESKTNIELKNNCINHTLICPLSLKTKFSYLWVTWNKPTKITQARNLRRISRRARKWLLTLFSGCVS